MDMAALSEETARQMSPILPSKWWKGQKAFKVTPTAHFCMGGIVTDQCGETPLKGLFAVGEATAGVHGANRLGGNALAEILFGVVNPSGKLPITFPQRWEDSPAYGTYPGTREEAIYKEGIFVGYRHFDKENIDPLFPFGFGLSYSHFDLKNLDLSREAMTAQDTLIVSVTVKNRGNLPGEEVVQLGPRPRPHHAPSGGAE